jgi:signal transduction histidine kinase
MTPTRNASKAGLSTAQAEHEHPPLSPTPLGELALILRDEPSRLGTLLRWTLAVVLVGSLFLWAAGTLGQIKRADPMNLLATASVVILFGMAGMYAYMCKFYRDYFYALAALGWMANAFYMCLEGFPSSGQGTGFWVFVFAKVSFVPFYLASFCDQRNFDLKSALRPLSGWFAWMAATFLLGRWYATSRSAIPDLHKQLLIATLGGVFFSFWTLVRVGQSARIRVAGGEHRIWAAILPATFYFYAALQWLSPVRLFVGTTSKHLIHWVFAAALLAKVLNGVAAAIVLALDFNARIRQRGALEELGALTASIEHDVRNPLNVSNAIIFRAKERFQAAREILLPLERIEEQNRRILASTEIVRALRGGKDYYEKFFERASINDLITRSIKATKDDLKTEGINFVSPESKILYVRAYRALLEQSLVNVLKNAVEAIRKAGRKSGLVKIVQARTGRTGESVTVEISDNGCGIPEADRSKLGRFYSTKKNKPNSGIGLFITSRILEFHGGSLKIDSTEGEGTKVSLSLPAWKD